jgi:hypothetical protein
MTCPALLPIMRALLPLSDRLSAAEAGGVTNEKAATATNGNNLPKNRIS